MVNEVVIRNFALIEDLNLTFNPGFNVIMGETGAGKSNIIDAISIIFGDRATKDKIRKGTDSAYISITLDISNEGELVEYLKDKNLYEEGEPLIISRNIRLHSSTVSKVNDIPVTAKVLRELSQFIIDIYGQFDNNLILSREEQLKFVDRMGDKDFIGLKEEYSQVYDNYLRKKEKLENFEKSPEDLSQNVSFLEYQIKDIEDSGVLEMDFQAIYERLEIIENSHDIKTALYQSLDLLDGEDTSVLNSLGRIEQVLMPFDDLDQTYEETRSRISQCFIELGDIKYELMSLSESVEYDEEEYSSLSRQRDTIFDMGRKYGETKEEMEEYYERISKELDSIQNYGKILEGLKKDYEESKEKAENIGESLSSKRKRLAQRLEKDILKGLNDLDMKNSAFEIKFDLSDLSPSGIDSVEFLVSFNKNENLKRFSDVASGGEISRFMLAIKSIEADMDNRPILIFDEIDTGISGNAGNVVGDQLKELSKGRILISVSHLPQIIAKGDTQYLVYKSEENNNIFSDIIELDYEERITELAKVIQGDNYNEHTLLTAEKMLEENREV